MAKEEIFDGENIQKPELLPSDIAISEEELKDAVTIMPNPYHRAGRPKKYLKWSTIDKLCKLQCTLEEIAVKVGVTPELIERRVKETFGIEFKEYFRIKSQLGFVSLRRMQYELARSGNVTMQKWLGSNWLGQSDKVDMNMTGSVQMNININPSLVPNIYKGEEDSNDDD
jgi:AraC-like DNA-binding protein